MEKITRITYGEGGSGIYKIGNGDIPYNKINTWGIIILIVFNIVCAVLNESDDWVPYNNEGKSLVVLDQFKHKKSYVAYNGVRYVVSYWKNKKTGKSYTNDQYDTLVYNNEDWFFIHVIGSIIITLLIIVIRNTCGCSYESATYGGWFAGEM